MRASITTVNAARVVKRMRQIMIISLSMVILMTQVGYASSNFNDNHGRGHGAAGKGGGGFHGEGFKLSMSSKFDDLMMNNPTFPATPTEPLDQMRESKNNDSRLRKYAGFNSNHVPTSSSSSSPITTAPNHNNHHNNNNHEMKKGTKNTKPWQKDVLKSSSFLPSSRFFMSKNNQHQQILKRTQKGRAIFDFGTDHKSSSRQCLQNHQQQQQQSERNKSLSSIWSTLSNRLKQLQPLEHDDETNILNNKPPPPSSSSSSQKNDYNSNNNNIINKNNKKKKKDDLFLHHSKDAKIRITVDPSAVGRLSIILLFAVSSFTSAFMGTLRLLGPLVVSRRVLLFMWTLLSDWYAGRYFRTTFTRMEKFYIHYYEAPATFRAISRCLSQMVVYLSLARKETLMSRTACCMQQPTACSTRRQHGDHNILVSFIIRSWRF